MNFPDAAVGCFQKYVTFSGRASRSEYWYWVLFTFLSVLGLAVVATAVPKLGDILMPLFQLATFLPGLSVLVRRLHDVNKSGWWFWILMVPFIGIILILIWFCTKGTTGDNRFGPDPLA